MKVNRQYTQKWVKTATSRWQTFFFHQTFYRFPGQPQWLQRLHIGRQKKRRSKDVSNKSYLFFTARHEYTNSVNNIQVIFSVERREIG